jgi:hypothetical protein
MAVNASKKHSPQAWNKWLTSGAIAGVRYQPGPEGFGTIKFTRTVSVREIIAFYEKCGLKLAKIGDLDAITKAFSATNVVEPSVPTSKESWLKPFDRLPTVGRFDGQVQLSWPGGDDWDRNLGFVSVLRD